MTVFHKISIKTATVILVLGLSFAALVYALGGAHWPQWSKINSHDGYATATDAVEAGISSNGGSLDKCECENFTDGITDDFVFTNVTQKTNFTSKSEDYTRYEKRYIVGSNIKEYGDLTVNQCKVKCNADPDCKAVEYGLGSGTKPDEEKQCRFNNKTYREQQPLGGTKYSSNWDVYDKDYTQNKGKYIVGSNVKSVKNSTVDQCKDECNARPDCKAFEYGLVGKKHSEKCRLNNKAYKDRSKYTGGTKSSSNWDVYDKV
jgi:hypothetical protein